MNRLHRFIEFVWVLLVLMALIIWVLPDFFRHRRRRK